MKARQGLLIGVLLATCGAAFCGQPTADPASGADCAHVNMQAARRAVEDAKRLFESGDVKAAHKAIDASLDDARLSVDCSLQTSKREKATEIDLRRLIERMKEVLHTLDTEERPQLARSLTELEAQRDRLLHAMFGAAAGGGAPEKKP